MSYTNNVIPVKVRMRVMDNIQFIINSKKGHEINVKLLSLFPTFGKGNSKINVLFSIHSESQTKQFFKKYLIGNNHYIS